MWSKTGRMRFMLVSRVSSTLYRVHQRALHGLVIGLGRPPVGVDVSLSALGPRGGELS